MAHSITTTDRQLVDYSSELRPPAVSDLPLLVITLMLVAFGMVMVYSTTGVMAQERFSDSFYFAKRHALTAITGLVLMLVLSRLNIEQLQKYSWLGFVIALVLLALPMIPGLGDSAGGAKRWVKILGFRFQPGEFAKLAITIFMAGFYARHHSRLEKFTQGILIPLCLLAPIALLYLVKPDFGSAVVVIAVAFGMGLACGVRLIHFAFCGVFLGSCAAMLVLLSPYRMARVVSFLSPMADVQGKGYQLIQSLIAIGSGELSGVGLGASQQKLFFLPAAHTDFIFAVVSEELGFFGALAVIAMFLTFLWRGFVIAGRLTQDHFAYALGCGLTLLIVLPAFLNIGVATGLLPTKGMVLPFIAYGGSSLLSSLACSGLLLALARHFRKHVR